LFLNTPIYPGLLDFLLFPTSGILKNTKEHNVSEIGYSLLRRGGGRHLRRETNPISETLCSLVFFRISYVGQSQEPSNPECLLPSMSFPDVEKPK
jgi:hypothetical protein